MLSANFIHSLLLLSLFSAFKVGTSIDLDEWALSLHDSIAELEREPIIIKQDSKELPPLRDIQSFEDKLRLFYYQLYNPPKFVIIKKYERRLRAPVFSALSNCSELVKSISANDQIGEGGGEAADEHLMAMAKIRSLIMGLQTDFGTFYAEISMKKIGKCKWTSKMLPCVVAKINQIVAFAEQSGSYCDLSPFERATEMLNDLISRKELANRSEEQAQRIVDELVVEMKMAIWLNEVKTKMINFEKPFVDIKGFFKFSSDLSAELAEINAAICKWPNSMNKKEELNGKIGKLISIAMEKSHFLKQLIVQKLDGLLKKATNAFEELKSELEETKEAEENFMKFNRKIIDIYSDRAMHMPDDVDFAVFGVLERTKRGELLLPTAFEELQKVIEHEKRRAIEAFEQRKGQAEKC
ncbi:hypothetical protein niasHS_017956 [Heterodera schachtii]|uniref:Uncharacterized protein n=1 Tax=Heterodera schachtii TaxID=97005 RepID=A0ABD2HYJ3_HETSC